MNKQITVEGKFPIKRLYDLKLKDAILLRAMAGEGQKMAKAEKEMKEAQDRLTVISEERNIFSHELLDLQAQWDYINDTGAEDKILNN